MRTYDSVRVLVQLLDGTVDSVPLPTFFLREDADLDDIRKALVDGPLGTVERDIFFPSWTKSIHVLQGPHEQHSSLTPSDIDQQKVTIESPEQLQELLDAEQDTPGMTTIVLQQCRSKRYSRRKDDVQNTPPSCTLANPILTPGSLSGVGSSPKSITNPYQYTSNQHQHGPQHAQYQNSKYHHHHHHHHHHANNNNNTSTGINNHHNNHNHHHNLSNHNNPNNHNSNNINNNSTSTSNINSNSNNNSKMHSNSYSSKSYSKRNYHVVEPPLPPFPPPSFVAPPPVATSAGQGYDGDHAVFFYPEPFVPYGMMPPHAVMPPVYAVPWNVGCYNYVSAPGMAPTWYLA